MILTMKMKKRWTSSIRTESQDLIDQISWNSSSSEEGDIEEKNPKKLKSYFPKSVDDKKSSLISSLEAKPNKVKDFNHANESSSSFKSDECVINFGEKSPILTSKSIFQHLPMSDSPIISQNYLFREPSPVLSCREVIKSVRRKKKEIVKRTKIDGSSPDIFLSQASKIIEENNSPEKTSSTCSQDLANIELISSQEGSNVTIINPSTSESSRNLTDLSSGCYHEPSPRRKSCKKNGLFYQLQRTLNLRKSRLSLWHHDIFCEKVILSDLEHISGIIRYKWKDFGCTILKCRDNSSKNNTNIFLISLGSNTDPNIVLDTNQIIKIYPPFKQKFVQFEKKEIKIYYNLTKIITESTNESIT